MVKKADDAAAKVAAAEKKKADDAAAKVAAAEKKKADDAAAKVAAESEASPKTVRKEAGTFKQPQKAFGYNEAKAAQAEQAAEASEADE